MISLNVIVHRSIFVGARLFEVDRGHPHSKPSPLTPFLADSGNPRTVPDRQGCPSHAIRAASRKDWEEGLEDQGSHEIELGRQNRSGGLLRHAHGLTRSVMEDVSGFMSHAHRPYTAQQVAEARTRAPVEGPRPSGKETMDTGFPREVSYRPGKRWAARRDAGGL